MNYSDEILRQHRDDWVRLVQNYKKHVNEMSATFINECIQRTDDEITVREDAAIKEFEKSLAALKADQEKPSARKFILDQRSESLKRAFKQQMDFFASTRATTLKGYLAHMPK